MVFFFGIDRDRKYDVVITKMNEGKKEKIVKKNSKKGIQNSKN